MSDRPIPTDTGAEPVPDPAHLRTRLSAIGDRIPVPPTDDDLIGVERVAGRRTRRRRTVAGLIGVGALAVGGAVLVAVNGEDMPDSVEVTADDPSEEPTDEPSSGGEGDAGDDAASDPASDDAETDTDTDDDGAAADAEPPAPGVATSPPTAAAGEATVVAADRTTTPGELAPGEYVNTTVHPWQDGFLLLESTWQAQPLPSSFPEEITALFPDEVVSLIEEAQPATINEAMDLLSEAGLLDEVTTVISEHPEASEAVYSIPPPPPDVNASFSADGVDWQPIDFVPPSTTGMNEQFQSDGDRLVGLSYDFEPQGVGGAGPYFGGPPQVASIRVVSTTDLRTWDELEIPVPVTQEELPEFVVQSMFPMGFAFNDDGWAVVLESSTDVDYEAVFADLLPLDDPAGGGFGTNVTEEGVGLQRFDERGGLVDETVVTWEELGVDPISPELIYRAGPAQVVSGTFDGVVRDPVELAGHGTVFGIPAGFVRIGEPTMFSADGSNWVEVASPDGPPLFGAVKIRHGDELIVFAEVGPDEPMAAYVLDPSGPAWLPAAAPDLPSGSYDSFGMSMGANGVALYSVNVPIIPEPFETTASIDVDGYTLSQTMTHLGSSYALIGPDGEEIVAESFLNADVTYESDSDGPYEYLRYGPSGLVIVDPATDETLVEVTNAELNSLWEQLAPEPMYADAPPIMPETRLLATDGSSWIDEVLVPEQSMDDADAELDMPPAWPNGAAVNDGVVVVALSDGSIERFEF